MRVHFLYQIFSLIKLFDIWERLQGTLFLQFVPGNTRPVHEPADRGAPDSSRCF